MLLALLLGAPASARVATQAPGVAPSPGPGWQPRASALDVRAVDFTKAEQAAAIARLEEIEGLFRNVRVLVQPEDFDVGGYVKWRNAALGEQARSRKEIFSYDYRLNFWGPSYKIDPEVVDVIVVTVNPYPALLAGGWKPIVTDGESYEGEIYCERPRVDSPIPGAVVYDQLVAGSASFTQVLFTSGPELPWLPVSRERYLKAELARYTEAESATVEAYSQTPYQRWIAGATKRKEEREQGLAMAAVGSKENAAKAREALEQTEREVTEQLKAQEASDREQARKMAETPSIASKLRAQLAAMSPGERAEQAILNGTELGSFQFAPRETPNSLPLVAYNPAFYRAKGSTVAARAIVVYFEQDLPNPHHNWSDIGQAIYKTYKTLDWTALKGLLEP